MTVDEIDALFAARSAVLARLERPSEWAIENEQIVGLGTAAVIVRGHNAGAILSGGGQRWRAHIDITFVLDRDRPAMGSVPDCVTGFGGSEIAAIEFAAEQWANVTAPVVYELLFQDGSHATQFGESDPMGVSGFQVLHGPFQGFGIGEAPYALVEWASNVGLLHVLSPQLIPVITGAQLIGIKFFFGSNAGKDTAEVRIANVAWPHISAALLRLPWPRSTEMGYVRGLALVVHGQRAATVSTPMNELHAAAARLVKLVEIFPDLDDPDLVDALTAEGIEPSSARRLVAFVPTAFARVILESMGVTLDANFETPSSTGPSGRRPLQSIPEYVAGSTIAPALRGSAGFLQLAVRGSEMKAVDSLLQGGSKAEDVVLAPILVLWDIE
jgi:hypothetical protein